MSLNDTIKTDWTKFKAFVGEVETEIGLEAHALYAAVQYDVSKAMGSAVAVAKDDFVNLYITAKAQLATAWTSIQAEWNTNGYAAAIAMAKSLLAGINWKDVGATLEGIGLATLENFARTLLGMLVSGLLVPA